MCKQFIYIKQIHNFIDKPFFDYYYDDIHRKVADRTRAILRFSINLIYRIVKYNFRNRKITVFIKSCSSFLICFDQNKKFHQLFCLFVKYVAGWFLHSELLGSLSFKIVLFLNQVYLSYKAIDNNMQNTNKRANKCEV